VGQKGNSECVSTAVRPHGWLQCWYYCTYTWLTTVLVLLYVHMSGYSVGITVRTHAWLQCWYYCTYTCLATVLVLLYVHMPGCSVGITVRTHAWLQCWYYCTYTCLATVLVLLYVHMAGCSVGTAVRTHGWLQCVCRKPRSVGRSVSPPVTTLYAVYPTAALYDTALYRHVLNLLHVSTFLSHLQVVSR